MRHLITAAVVAVLAVSSASADLLAFWHCNNQTQIDPNSSLWQLNPLGTASAKTTYAGDAGSLASSTRLSVWGSGGAAEGTVTGTNGGVQNNNFGTFTGVANADPNVVAGGALSIIGNGNNAAYFIIQIDSAISAATLTFATRGTSTGYNSRVADYSTDGGTTWTALWTDSGVLTSTFVTKTITLNNIFALTSGPATNLLRLTVNGATSTNGNNRFDNIALTGIPEPASLLTLALAGLGLLRRR